MRRPGRYADGMSTSRSSLSRVLVLAGAALLLSACGPVRPGAAAVVGDSSISMDDVQTTTTAYCLISAVNAQQGSTTDLVELRRQAVANLLLTEVAEQAAAGRGIKVADRPLTEDQTAQIEQLFGSDSDEVTTVVESNQRVNALLVALARDAGAQGTDEQLAQAGQQIVAADAVKKGIKIDPRFGLSNSLQQVGTTGSLSVQAAELDTASAEDRPAALQCPKAG